MSKKGQSRKTKRRYTRVFSSEENADKAREMLLLGYNNMEVSRVFNVDPSSVFDFKKRCEKEGMVFPQQYVHIANRGTEFNIPVPPTITQAIRTIEIVIEVQRQKLNWSPTKDFSQNNEKLNEGKSYAEYLKEDNERTRVEREKMMAKAKESIDELNKWRVKNKIKWKDFAYDTGVY